VAEATTRLVTPATATCNAFTTTAPVEEIVCSLMVTTPPGMATTWFGAPVTLMGTPAIARLLKDELPVPALPAVPVPAAPPCADPPALTPPSAPADPAAPPEPTVVVAGLSLLLHAMTHAPIPKSTVPLVIRRKYFGGLSVHRGGPTRIVGIGDGKKSGTASVNAQLEGIQFRRN